MNTGGPVFRPRNYFLGAVALVLAGTIVGLGVSGSLNATRTSHAAEAQVAAVSSSASSLESPFTAVVDKALPAVVFIDVMKKASADDGSGAPDDFMRRFFGEPNRRQQRSPSSGSGFIIDREGRILTNNHVVRDADDIQVTLSDGRTFKAKVLGADPATDVAVIQISGQNLPVLSLGDSDNLRIGDWAIAIGNPLGDLRGSVTVGIVSARGRSNLNIFGGTPDFQDFIQTDASINFGNSGGPLCNIRGEVIGINTAINTSGQGIGFAIPINLAKHVAEQLIAHGSVKRAMIGVSLANMTPEIADGFGLPGQQGVIIQSVIKGSPAEKAGLQRNDVVVELNGQPVTDLQKFRLKVADTPSGTVVRLVVLRDGKRVPASVTLTDRDDNVVAGRQTPPASTDESQIGMTVRELNADEMRGLGLQAGVRVVDVADGGPASDSEIQPGDVIEEVNKTPVKSATEFNRLVGAAKKSEKPVVLIVNHGGATRYVAIKLDK